MKQWRILLLDTKRSNPNHYICLAIERALREHPAVDLVVKAEYLSAIESARSNGCNLLLAFDGEELNRSIVARLQSVCGTSVAWVTEDPYEQGTNKQNLDLFDLVFTNDRGSVDEYGKKGRHLPFAADQGMHFHAIPDASGENHYLYDLFFAGTAWPNRVQFLKELQSEIDGINLKLALPHNPYLPEFDLDLPPSAYQWRTPNSEFARFANRSRSVLTLHRVFSSSEDKAIALTPGPRLFEVALAGGVQFIDMSIEQVEVERYFREGTEFVGFRTADECIEKLRYYLQNEEERLRIARAAQQRARSEHLYLHRVESLLVEVSQLAQKLDQVAMAPPERPRRPKILFVTHNIMGVEPYGGVEVYQEALRKEMGDRFEFLFYTLDRGHASQRRYVLFDENVQYLEDHECASVVSDAHLVCNERESLLASILMRHGVDMVHFQHLIGHVPSLLYIPSVLGIPSMLSLHDYYGMCSRFNLIDYKGRYCDIPKLPKSVCDVCLNAGDGLAVGSQARRRAFFARALEQVDVLHANTEGVVETFKSIYPHGVTDERVRVFGVPMPRSTSIVRRARPQKGPMKVAILGNFTRNKGADEIIHAFNQLRHDDIKFTIFGQVASPYNEILNALGLSNVHVHGAYTAGSLAEALTGFSLSLHYSIWPETYCITLSEAWQAGLVPVVADTGALGERVIDGVNGYKVPPTQAGALVDLFRRLLHNPPAVEAVRAGITDDLYVEVGSHATWLGGVYEELMERKPSPVSTKSRSHSGRGLALSELGILLNHPTWKDPNHREPTVTTSAAAPPPSYSHHRCREGFSRTPEPMVSRQLSNACCVKCQG